MSEAKIARLPDRGIVSVTGEDARAFLDNLITNDLAALEKPGDAIHAALLTPQGKILFAFFVVQRPDGYILETDRERSADLAKRLTMYKLRAKVTINDLSANYATIAAWDGEPPRSPLYVAFADPRSDRLGVRLLMAPALAAKLEPGLLPAVHYDRHRIALGIVDGGRDYVLGDTFPHEANFDRFHGVSFTKGCFVGQEVVARMQNKTVVRKRVVRISGSGDLTSGADVTIGDAVIGKVGSVAGREALAMLRLDRAMEAVDKGQTITADGIAVTIEAEALKAYRDSAAERAAQAS